MRFLYKKTKAFSLIEVLVALVMIGLIATFSIVGLQKFQGSRKVKLYARALYHDLKWARIEAVLLNQPIKITPSNNNWCDGWVVAKDSNNSDSSDSESENNLLKQQAGLANCKIKFNSFPRRNYFKFLPEGMTDYQNGSYYFYQDNNLNLISKIIISQIGRIRFE